MRRSLTTQRVRRTVATRGRLRRFRKRGRGTVRVRTIARIGGAMAVAGMPLLLWAAPASASKTGPCDGSATINGKTYTPANDTASNAIDVPKTGIVTYHGDTGGVVITDAKGEV